MGLCVILTSAHVSVRLKRAAKDVKNSAGSYTVRTSLSFPPATHTHSLSCSVFPMLSVSAEWLVTNSPLLCKRSAGSLERKSQLSFRKATVPRAFSLSVSQSAISNQNMLLMVQRGWWDSGVEMVFVTGETRGVTEWTVLWPQPARQARKGVTAPQPQLLPLLLLSKAAV